MDIRREGTVSNFYRGKTVFVTGASGSIGKVLLWKLLLSCSGIDTIYVLIRSKKGKPAHIRLNELFRTPVTEIYFLMGFYELALFKRV